jgi:hypothetical protein
MRLLIFFLTCYQCLAAERSTYPVPEELFMRSYLAFPGEHKAHVTPMKKCNWSSQPVL